MTPDDDSWITQVLLSFCTIEVLLGMYDHSLMVNVVVSFFSQTCQNCGAAIEPSHFHQEKLQRMQASIHDTLSKHHSESFETFLQFLQKNTDFRYVVDGMWILHKITRGNASTSDEKKQAGKQMKV